MIRILFLLPSGEQKEVLSGRGSNLRLLALKRGLPLYAPLDRLMNCHGNGLCGKCRLEVLEGKGNLSPPSVMERWKLGKLLWVGLRLACQTRAYGPVVVRLQPDLRAKRGELRSLLSRSSQEREKACCGGSAL